MRNAIRFTVILALLAVVAFAERTKSIIHVSHLTPTEVGITCANGGDPTGVKTGLETCWSFRAGSRWASTSKNETLADHGCTEPTGGRMEIIETLLVIFVVIYVLDALVNL